MVLHSKAVTMLLTGCGLMILIVSVVLQRKRKLSTYETVKVNV